MRADNSLDQLDSVCGLEVFVSLTCNGPGPAQATPLP